MYAAAWGFHVVIALGALGLMRLHRYLGPWDAVTLAALLALLHGAVYGVPRQ